ncbi:hypothetical protein Ancab_019144 [Ancistrocladus abbreviatus]
MALAAANPGDSLHTAVNKELESALCPSLELVDGEVNIERLEMQEMEPPFMKFINEIRSLATVTQVFQSRWDELQKHLEFIEDAIQSREKQLAGSSDNQQQQQTNVILREAETSSFNAEKVTDSNLAGLHCQESEPSRSEMIGSSIGGELDNLCKKMLGRELRKYILSHLSDFNKLCKEVPAALKSAPDPAKLVLECVGKFYLQGSKAYITNSPQISSRKAALFILEFFLLMGGCDEIEPSLKEEADSAAVAWRKRLITEGGLSHASFADARGLLLFVSCFGIPGVFATEDLIHLLLLSNPRKIGEALRKSSFLVMRISEIIHAMKERGMDVEAVDVIYTFQLEHKFSPMTILTSFLTKLKEVSVAEKRDAQDLAVLLTTAIKKHLTGLRSVVNCLEAHKVDATKLLPGGKLKEQITTLEKDLAKQQGRARAKRKADKPDPAEGLRKQDIKRSRFVSDASASGASPIGGLRESNITDIPLYTADSRPAVRINDYAVASAVPRYVPGYIPENAVGAGSRSGLLPASVSGLVPASAAVPGGVMGDRFNQSIGDSVWPRDRLIDRSHSFLGPSSSIDCFPGLPSTSYVGVGNRTATSDLYQFADTVLDGNQGSGLRQAGGMQPPSSLRFLY